MRAAHAYRRNEQSGHQAIKDLCENLGARLSIQWKHHFAELQIQPANRTGSDNSLLI